MTFRDFIGGRGDCTGGPARRASLSRPTTLWAGSAVGQSRVRCPRPAGSFLLARLAWLGEALPRLRYPLPPGPVHGDAYMRNLMVTAGGPVLIGFERAWRGSRGGTWR